MSSDSNDLPPPPQGKTGWPWTQAAPPLPPLMVDGAAWPKVSIVTPSLNQEDYIERTIRSVLLQGYPNLEYILIDGGSTDSSVEIIQKYAPWLAYWVSEPDCGQAQAINKGFRHAHGEIMAWINSDDYYYPGALEFAVSRLMSSSAELLIAGVDIIAPRGDELEITKHVSPLHGPAIHLFPIFKNGRTEDFFFTQPAMFWRRSLWVRTGELNEELHYVMDREWCLRALAKGMRLVLDEKPLTRFTYHQGSKSFEENSAFSREAAKMYWALSKNKEFRRLATWIEGLYSALRYAQSVSAHKASEFSSKNQKVPAFFWRSTSQVARRLRLFIKARGNSMKLRPNSSFR